LTISDSNTSALHLNDQSVSFLWRAALSNYFRNINGVNNRNLNVDAFVARILRVAIEHVGDSSQAAGKRIPSTTADSQNPSGFCSILLHESSPAVKSSSLVEKGRGLRNIWICVAQIAMGTIVLWVFYESTQILAKMILNRRYEREEDSATSPTVVLRTAVWVNENGDGGNDTQPHDSNNTNNCTTGMKNYSSRIDGTEKTLVAELIKRSPESRRTRSLREKNSGTYNTDSTVSKEYITESPFNMRVVSSAHSNHQNDTVGSPFSSEVAGSSPRHSYRLRSTTKKIENSAALRKS
jgi:hypothetical protein